MNNKLLYGVMTAQLLIMAGTQIHNNDVVSRKSAEINKQDKIIAEFKEIDRLQEQEFDNMTNKINETNSKLSESERVRSEQIQIVESQKGTIAEQQKVINQLRAELQKTQQQPQVQAVKTDNNPVESDSKIINVKITSYTNSPSENGGLYKGEVRTKTGYSITNTIYYKGYRVIAVDPNVIPLNSIVELNIEGYGVFNCVAIDVGGAIKNNRIDFLTDSSNWAVKFGIRKGTAKIIGRI